jgi:cytochrome bd-type quinol oxidase subunit 2
MSDVNPKKTGNGISIASLVLGIVGVIFLGGLIIPGILGLIFGIMGIQTEKKNMAIAGIVLNSFQILLTIIFIMVLIMNPNILNLN